MTARRPNAGLADSGRRLRGGFVVLVIVLTVIGGRLVQLQGLQASAYAAQAERQRLRRVTLPAARGQIVDRNGHPLAVNVDARAVYADPKLIDDPTRTAQAVAPHLRVPAGELLKKLSRRTRFVYLARGLDPRLAQRVVALKLAGIGTVKETRRVYPDHSLGAAVIGFVGRDGAGLGGVESARERELAGTPGEIVVEEDLQGRQIPSGERAERLPVAGVTQMLTIDRDIQWAAEHALAQRVTQTNASGGHVLVLDASSGEVLALAVTPTYDPNYASRAPASARGNPALSEVFEPGSVNKVVTAAAALETGLLLPDTRVTVPPEIRVADKVFHDAHAHGTLQLTFTGVIAESSNIGTIGIAQRLGKQTVESYLRRFGLGAKTGIAFPGESAGLLPPSRRWSGSQVGTIPIGQGVSATALQMACVFAAVANGGVRVQPSLLRGTVDASGRLHPAPEPRRTRAVTARTAALLTRMLEAVVTPGGTGSLAAIDGYRVAGKTGTARKVRADGRGYAGYVSSFIGFAPADAPRIVVEVVLNDPTPIYGGVVAAPVFRTVAGFALKTLRVPPTGRPAPVSRLTAE